MFYPMQNYVHILLSGDIVLRQKKPDATYYIGLDAFWKEHPSYYHSEFYPIEKMSPLGKTSSTPQINNISFKVTTMYMQSVMHRKIYILYIYICIIPYLDY